MTLVARSFGPTDVAELRGRRGRVYFVNPQEKVPAPGYRGYVVLDGEWVHIFRPEHVPIHVGDGWEPHDSGGTFSVPVHLVELIEWDPVE